MKILHINAVYGFGSTGVILRDIHNLCLSRGIDSVVCYSESNEAKVKNGYQIGSTFGKKLHALFSRISGKQGYYSRFATKNLIKLIKKEKPDIVNLHNLHSNFINLNMLLDFLAKSKIKTVATLHDCWFYTGGCFHYTSANCDKWKKNCGNCPNKRVGHPPYLFDASPKILADRIKYFSKIENLTFVGVSQWIIDEARNSKVPAKRYETVPNGVNFDVFREVKSDILKELGIKNKFTVLAIGNKWLLPINNGLLEKFCRHFGDEISVILVDRNVERLTDLPNNVVTLEYLKDMERLIKLYSAVDVFVNPTREESFSLVNVEAQACRTPVVTYKNTGAQETVDQVTGFAVENGNVEALIEAVSEIKKRKKESFSNCREFVQSKFDYIKSYNRLIEIYEEIYKD